MSLDAQAKLLRVLETGEVERVGGERRKTVDVRVIAATNRDLQRSSADGGFREDLFYRLNVFPIRVPPLRERVGDLPALSGHFAALLARRCGRPAVTFSNDAMVRMQEHGWPGNVRELANVIERFTILAEGRVVDPDALDVVLGAPRVSPAPTSVDASQGLNAVLDACERSFIADALSEANGNVSEAARRLQTDRANLYRRMRRLGLRQ